jgi:hypothetical protein
MDDSREFFMRVGQVYWLRWVGRRAENHIAFTGLNSWALWMDRFWIGRGRLQAVDYPTNACIDGDPSKPRSFLCFCFVGCTF